MRNEYTILACDDCVMMLANGEGEVALAERIEARHKGFHLAVGEPAVAA